MGNKGASSGKAGAGAGVKSNSQAYSNAEQAIREADTRRELRDAVNSFLDELSPGDEFTTATTRDYQNMPGAGEVFELSVRTFRVTENKTIVDSTGKEYTASEFANAVYRGSINLNAIEPGRVNAQEFAGKRYGKKGSVQS